MKDKRYMEKHYSIMGTYLGVIGGAVVMMVAGALGYKTVANLSLIFGLCAGPSIGYLLGKMKCSPEDNSTSGK